MPQDVADLFGVNVRTVQNWIAGKGTRTPLRAFRCGKTLRLTQEDVQEFYVSHYEQPTVQVTVRTRTQKNVDHVCREIRDQRTQETLKRFKVI